MNKQVSIKTTKVIYPQIYAYTLPSIPEDAGWIKIGYTEREDVDTRIKEQTNTAAIQLKYDKLWSAPAKFAGSNGWFTDKQFHRYLRTFKHVDQRKGSEWFYYNGTPEQSQVDFNDFRDKVHDQSKETLDYMLRSEQQVAVNQTYEYATSHEGGEFLWNAKPRFGKTLATYDLARKMDAGKVLVVTNRPAIANSWFDDFEKFIAWQTDFAFVSTSDSLKDRPVMTREEFTAQLDGGKDRMIAFISLQDLKGAIPFGGDYPKLDWVKKLEWDMLVIDESHEGVDTFKTDIAFDNIKRSFTLNLSGTPFKAVASGKFADDQIFNWTYADEQEAKADWPVDSEKNNPYAALPKLNLYSYQMSRMITDKVDKGADIDGDSVDFAFDLNEFFDTNESGKFVHEKDVKKWLDTLSANEKYPFSTPELRTELKHTFWLLNRVASAKALEKLLKKHPVFENYYIVLAAGDGKNSDDQVVNQKALDRVRDAIKEHEKTITLSVGQLTTGITVPEWTGVLMLSNLKSPSLYMQAAFRSQNPWTYSVDGKIRQKENSYVFDFAPERTLTLFDEFANNLSSDTSNGGGTTESRKDKIQQLLNFFPVIAEDNEGKMVALDAGQVLTIPKSIKAQEVVRKGFMSNLLFQNISGIFASSGAREILDQLNPVDQGKSVPRQTSDPVDTKGVTVDSDGDAVADQEIVVAKTDAHFGDKVYADVANAAASAVAEPNANLANDIAKSFKEQTLDGLKTIAQESGLSARNAEQAAQNSAKKLARTVETVQRKSEIELKEASAEYEVQVHEAQQDAAKIAAAKEAFDKRQKQIQVDTSRKIVDEVSSKAKQLMQESTNNLLTKAEEKKKNTVEDDVRARLRGFTRTIPSFLMAYGDVGTTLANFDLTISGAVFREVTGITLEQFRTLRDTYQFFDSVVFDESCQEFLRKKRDLSDYFDESQEEDIFDYIPPQQTNQIFTPKKVVIMMVDGLEELNPGIFKDPDKTFADLYVKSGLYLAEIVKRLFKGLQETIPNEAARLKHILETQVYGFAPTEIIHNIAKNYVFGFDLIGKDINTDHLVHLNTEKIALEDDDFESVCEKLFGGDSLKFDVVIGNPPYQENDGGAQSSASPVYQNFVNIGLRAAVQTCLIMPSRWYVGGKGLNGFRDEILHSPFVKELIDFPDPSDVFPGTNIRGGVCILYLDTRYDAENERTRVITYARDKIIHDTRRPMSTRGLDIFIRDEKALSILEKILAKSSQSMLIDNISPRKPFCLDGTLIVRQAFQTNSEGLNQPVKCFAKGTVGFIERVDVPLHAEWIDQWKVLTARANNIGTELNDDNLNTIVAGPGSACTETYILIGTNLGLDERQTTNLSKYLKTKFVRYLHSLAKSSQDAARQTYRFVPRQDFSENSEINWNEPYINIDEQLFTMYGLTPSEKNVISNKIKNME